MQTRFLMTAGLAALTLACTKEENGSDAGAAEARAVLERRGPSGQTTVTGVVKFVGQASANPAIDMSEEPTCQAKYRTPPRQRIVVVNPNGTLSNVFVYVKSGLPRDATYAPPSNPVTIDQEGCRYHPRVLGLMVGQPLRIENSDSLLHNIKATGKANRPFNISQPVAGMTTERTFATPEVMLPLECSVHGWMHAYLGVLPHPFFSTTGSDGAYTIKNVPPGTYTIEAWHEKHGTRTASVTVRDDETQSVDFTYAP
jgi:plastocyanin